MEGGLSGRPTECRYCRCPGPKGRCHGNHFLAFCIWGAHWCHLANTTEPSVCGGYAALCQITLTTCKNTVSYTACRLLYGSLRLFLRSWPIQNSLVYYLIEKIVCNDGAYHNKVNAEFQSIFCSISRYVAIFNRLHGVTQDLRRI